MSRFYVSPESVKGEKIYVEKEESHHIVDVMRLREGDAVTVFDGTGKEYRGTIASTENKRVIIDVTDVNSVSKKQTVSISLAQAIPKKDKMDLIIQKATELGVEEILPVESARTVVKPKGERRQRKIERWQKIVVEASKQCGRTELPKVREIVRFDAILDYIPKCDLVIMPSLSKKAISLKSVLPPKADQPQAEENVTKPKKILVIIGPEGGFSEDEIARAAEKGAVLVSLGNLTLRSDTAAIATLSIINYHLQ